MINEWINKGVFFKENVAGSQYSDHLKTSVRLID